MQLYRGLNLHQVTEMIVTLGDSDRHSGSGTWSTGIVLLDLVVDEYLLCIINLLPTPDFIEESRSRSHPYM